MRLYVRMCDVSLRHWPASSFTRSPTHSRRNLHQKMTKSTRPLTTWTSLEEEEVEEEEEGELATKTLGTRATATFPRRRRQRHTVHETQRARFVVTITRKCDARRALTSSTPTTATVEACRNDLPRPCNIRASGITSSKGQSRGAEARTGRTVVPFRCPRWSTTSRTRI